VFRGEGAEAAGGEAFEGVEVGDRLGEEGPLREVGEVQAVRLGEVRKGERGVEEGAEKVTVEGGVHTETVPRGEGECKGKVW